MAAYLTQAIVDAYIGETVREELTGGDSSVLTQMIADASGVFDAAALNAGYAVPFSGSAGTQHPVILYGTLGALITSLYARRGLSVPAQFALYTNILAAVRQGELPIPGLSPDAADAVGGVAFTESNEDVTGSSPRVFSGLRGVY